MQAVPAKTILQRNKSTAWFGCEYNMNLYRGCCHGCLYCDSRSDCYHVENFDTVRAKEGALRILRDELAHKTQTAVAATGAMSDPYNPFEREEKLTRHALELLQAYGFGVAIATKSDGITRDIDVLQAVAEQAPVLCKLTITAANDTLSETLEPHAPVSSQRFAAVEKLALAGLYAGVLLMPVLPFVEDNDANVLDIVERAAAAGARFVYPMFGVTMRTGQREHFLTGLDKAFPDRQLGAQYRSRYRDRYFCSSPRAQHLWEILSQACKQNGLLYQMPDIVRGYRAGGYQPQQLSLW